MTRYYVDNSGLMGALTGKDPVPAVLRKYSDGSPLFCNSPNVDGVA